MAPRGSQELCHRLPAGLKRELIALTNRHYHRLHGSHTGNTTLAAIIYLYQISDNRIESQRRKDFETLERLLGSKSMPNVVIATTMWSKVVGEEGSRRENELKDNFLRSMIADGCKTKRFEETSGSAWGIVGMNLDTTIDLPVVLLKKTFLDRITNLFR